MELPNSGEDALLPFPIMRLSEVTLLLVQAPTELFRLLNIGLGTKSSKSGEGLRILTWSGFPDGASVGSPSKVLCFKMLLTLVAGSVAGFAYN